MFTYVNFIDELKPLLESGRSLHDLPQGREGKEFRRWVHEVKDLMQRIEAQKYRINHNIYTRKFDYFGGYSHNPTPKERMAAYNQDLDDTLLELETIIVHAEKYGDPKSSQPAKAGVPKAEMAPASLQMPDKITAAWLWHHSPISLWLQAMSVIVAVFTAGIIVGQSSLYSDLTKKLAPSEQAMSVPSSASTQPPEKSSWRRFEERH